ncbi:hypothetical protein OC834_001146 [Tilletia horrida]|nr:hypothetical protein OC834_001146 [Tilletia horrida]
MRNLAILTLALMTVTTAIPSEVQDHRSHGGVHHGAGQTFVAPEFAPGGGAEPRGLFKRTEPPKKQTKSRTRFVTAVLLAGGSLAGLGATGQMYLKNYGRSEPDGDDWNHRASAVSRRDIILEPRKANRDDWALRLGTLAATGGLIVTSIANHNLRIMKNNPPPPTPPVKSRELHDHKARPERKPAVIALLPRTRPSRMPSSSSTPQDPNKFKKKVAGTLELLAGGTALMGVPLAIANVMHIGKPPHQP